MTWIRRRWLRVRLWWLMAEAWADARWPFYCGRCGRWTQYRYTEQARTTTGQWVRMCQDCYDGLHRPFSRGGN